MFARNGRARSVQGRHCRSKHRLSGKCVRNIPVQPDQVGEKSRDFRHHLSRGSHSIYVDLAAAIAAVRLLRPGALFLFDDVRFSFGRRRLIPTAGRVRLLGTPEVAAMVVRSLELANVPDGRVVVLSEIDDRFMIKEPADQSATSSPRRASQLQAPAQGRSHAALQASCALMCSVMAMLSGSRVQFCKAAPACVARVNEAHAASWWRS